MEQFLGEGRLPWPEEAGAVLLGFGEPRKRGQVVQTQPHPAARGGVLGEPSKIFGTNVPKKGPPTGPVAAWGATPRRQAKRGNPMRAVGRPARGLRTQTQASEGEADAQRSPRRGLPRFARAAPSRPTAGAGVAKRRKASYHLAGAASSRANAAKSPTGDRPKVGRMVPVGPRKMCIWRCRGSVADSDCGSDTLKTDRNQKQLQDVG